MKSDELIDGNSSLELVAEGLCWSEGPVWVPELHGFVLSDISGNASYLYRPGEPLQVFAKPSTHTNGRTIDSVGDLIECSNDLRAVVRRKATNPDSVEIIADHYGPARLNAPNDVIVSNDGTIWFTDPAYGIEIPGESSSLGQREYGDRWVFAMNPDGSDLRPVITTVIAPNGLAFSPDEKYLYVADSSASGGEDGPGHHIWRFAMYEELPKSGERLIEIAVEVPDGIKVDQEGRIWSSAGDGVRIYSPDGKPLGHVPVDRRVANLAWGGEDGRLLLICAIDRLYTIRTKTTDTLWGRFR